MTDTLPTLSSEEVEQIEKESYKAVSRREDQSPDFVDGHIAGATLYARRAKAEREELLKAAQEFKDFVHWNRHYLSDVSEYPAELANLEAAITKCIGNQK